MQKHELEELVARQAGPGAIVEIGVAGGNGVRALWAGAGRRIHAVDPFLPCIDLNGHPYGPDDEGAFYRTLAAHPEIEVAPIKQDGATAGQEWDSGPVALLWVDLTEPAATLRAIYDAWEPHIAPGGTLVLMNTEYTYTGCGAEAVALYALSCGGWSPVYINGNHMAAILRRDGG